MEVKPIEPSMDQGGTDPQSLPLGPNGNGTQAVPARGHSIDLNGGERDMPDKLAVFVGDQRHRQRVASAKPFDDR
jgi:hypothetical protein